MTDERAKYLDKMRENVGDVAFSYDLPAAAIDAETFRKNVNRAVLGIDPTDPVILAQWSDREVLDANQRTDGEPGDAEAEALLAEIEKRGLDI